MWVNLWSNSKSYTLLVDMIQSWWKIVGSFLVSYTYLYHTIQQSYSKRDENTCSPKTCMQMHIRVIFIIVNYWEQFKFLLTGNG